MKRLVFLMALAVCCLGGFGPANAKGKWFDYDGGKIDLTNIKAISGKIYLTYHPTLTKELRDYLGSFGPEGTAQFEREGGVIALLEQTKAVGDEGIEKAVTYGCSQVGFGRWVNPLTERDIARVIGAFGQGKLPCYQDVEVVAYIIFDSFKVIVYEFSKENGLTQADLEAIDHGLKMALKQLKGLD